MSFLQRFYFLRAGVAFVWVALVVLLSRLQVPALVTDALLVLYPAWDAGANILDARRSGGLRANPGQRLNALISLATAVVLAIALAVRGNAGGVLVFGLWALLSGLLQLLVGVRRRQLGGQVFMMISGGQSALAGVFMAMQAFGKVPTIAQLAPYAAFGGLYFLLAALRLTFKRSRPLQPSSN
ncbi:hypothetical protein [Fulvimonas soli]|uniref:DUF308 domain-containing protein n=1 Tax=Fulvimonas soli TaxID=155197 RepID=A0A316IH73_9GAMM|nr:hypothetical protein [Fulvimonas soli]PWK92721.1 hypothetical protein C7456_10153 [Fulvimonas soli]TNY25898.1 hypothetical protein BV497_11615 [Fulvimonas soli]